MRILFVAPFFEPAWALGGMAKSPSAWARALAATGQTVDIFTTTANGASELSVVPGQVVHRGDIDVTYFRRFRWSGNRYISPSLMTSCIRSTTHYDVIHSVGLWTFPSAVASAVAHLSHIPFVVSLHGTLMPWAYQHHGWRKRISMALWERQRLRLSAGVICSSQLEKRNFETLGLPAKTFIVPNIIDPIDIDPELSSQRFRKRYFLGDAKLLLFSGRLVRNKGFHLSISAFAKIAHANGNAQLLIVGPAEDESDRMARQQVRDLGIERRVRFLGLLTGQDYWDAVAAADLFVLNSYSENFGMAPAEALSLGVPVLLSDQVGIADTVEKYKAGIVTPLDIDAIASAMTLMLTHHESRLMMGRQGKRLVQECYTPKVVGERLRDLFTEIVAASTLKQV